MPEYSKFKERKPEDTVFEIQKILNRIGLFPVVNWTPRSYEGARSNRITLYPTSLGTNGKGTDELYCSASGYGELIERLSNQMLPIRDRMDDVFPEVGFHEFPDEKVMTISEILENPDPYTSTVLAEMGCEGILSKYAFLRVVASFYGSDCDRIVTVPFADPANNRVVYLPHRLLLSIVGSNGMAAGNTLDEAMVQALSEVFERAVSHKLILGEIVPPEIPDEELEKYSFYSLIEQVRAEGKYRVTIYDCSLGKGWPVAGILISDLETGTFGFKVGAHPSLAVACERTLTEALQGRNMESFTSTCILGSEEDSASYHNYPNVSKIGVGVYPASLFSKTPDWAFAPWTGWEGLSNKELLDGMIGLLKNEGLTPLFRDTSFLGFPSCFIVVPGFSNLYLTGETLARAMGTQVQTLSYWEHFPDLKEEEEKKLLRLIRFKRKAVLENQINIFSLRPLSNNYSLDKIAAWLAVKQGDFALAQQYFRRYSRSITDGEELIYLKAMGSYCELREMGRTPEEAHRIIGRFYCDAAAARVCEDTADESRVMQKQFEKLTCYDCGNCPAAGKDCDYINVRRVIIKTLKAMRPENVSQEKLLERLAPVFGQE